MCLLVSICSRLLRLLSGALPHLHKLALQSLEVAVHLLNLAPHGGILLVPRCEAVVQLGAPIVEPSRGLQTGRYIVSIRPLLGGMLVLSKLLPEGCPTFPDLRRKARGKLRKLCENLCVVRIERLFAQLLGLGRGTTTVVFQLPPQLPSQALQLAAHGGPRKGRDIALWKAGGRCRSLPAGLPLPHRPLAQRLPLPPGGGGGGALLLALLLVVPALLEEACAEVLPQSRGDLGNFSLAPRTKMLKLRGPLGRCLGRCPLCRMLHAQQRRAVSNLGQFEEAVRQRSALLRRCLLCRTLRRPLRSQKRKAGAGLHAFPQGICQSRTLLRSRPLCSPLRLPLPPRDSAGPTGLELCTQSLREAAVLFLHECPQPRLLPGGGAREGGAQLLGEPCAGLPELLLHGLRQRGELLLVPGAKVRIQFGK
mmetsp:Transcript_180731/g.573588  ORF Transcript_180731/g.573588 Transcript_180731/m.573588 type:complete len:422 (-) Transcript_180731:273-1538(-)